MIQFNLLPDIKLEYIKTKRIKRMIMVAAIVIGVVSFTITLVMFVRVKAQQRHIGNLTEDISTMTQQITNTEDINKILTVQNQLNSLGELHDQKPVATRLFNFLTKVTPVESSINRLQLSYIDNSLVINGNADSLVNVNKFVDTLKFTKFRDLSAESEDRDNEPTDLSSYNNAFSGVRLAGFSVEEGQTSYTIEMIFDPQIFDSKIDVQLLVPKQFITTRSEIERPGALFDGPVIESEEGAL